MARLPEAMKIMNDPPHNVVSDKFRVKRVLTTGLTFEEADVEERAY
jgi:hypothetical protein